MIIPLCLQNVSIVARNANVPDDNNGYCSSNEVFGVDVRFGEHVCQLYVLPRLGLSLIAVVLLFGDPPSVHCSMSKGMVLSDSWL